MLVCHPGGFWSGLRLNLNLCSKREKKKKKEERRRKMYSWDSDEHPNFK